MRKGRLLTWLVAIAIATPGPVTAWPASDDGAAPSPSARNVAGKTAPPALTPVSSRAAWQVCGAALADPTDEPGEGSDGWVSSLDQALPSWDGMLSIVAVAPGLLSALPSWSPLPTGTLCRLRC